MMKIRGSLAPKAVRSSVAAVYATIARGGVSESDVLVAKLTSVAESTTSSGKGDGSVRGGGFKDESFAKASEYGKTQPDAGKVAEETEKLWKSKEEEDDLLTLKVSDYNFDLPKRARRSGGG